MIAFVITAFMLPSTAFAAVDGYVSYDDDKLYGLDLTTGNTSALGFITAPDQVTALTIGPNGTMYAMAGGVLYSVDKISGNASELWTISTDVHDYFDGLTFTRGGVLIASVTSEDGVEPTAHAFLQIDLTNGDVDPLTSTEDVVLGLATACDGTVFALRATSTGSELARVSLANWAMTTVAPISAASLNGAEPTDIAFDHSTKKLWLLGTERELLHINTTTGAATNSGFTVQDQGATPYSLAFDPLSQCRFGRTLTLRYRKSAFRGRLQSQAAFCYKNIRVKVFRKRPGADLAIGSDLTSNLGHYAVPKPRRAGTYYARVTQRNTQQGICLSKQSAPLTLS